MPEIPAEVSKHMADIGKIGGSVRSDRKTKANQSNARKSWSPEARKKRWNGTRYNVGRKPVLPIEK
jgi:hypothetical protein